MLLLTNCLGYWFSKCRAQGYHRTRQQQGEGMGGSPSPAVACCSPHSSPTWELKLCMLVPAQPFVQPQPCVFYVLQSLQKEARYSVLRVGGEREEGVGVEGEEEIRSPSLRHAAMSSSRDGASEVLLHPWHKPPASLSKSLSTPVGWGRACYATPKEKKEGLAKMFGNL